MTITVTNTRKFKSLYVRYKDFSFVVVVTVVYNYCTLEDMSLDYSSWKGGNCTGMEDPN
jgi:hypothetical protein